MKYNRLALALAPLFSFAVTAAPDAVETAQKTADIERLIVTGSRIVESIDEVPVSVTLIDGESIKQQLLVSSELQNMLAQLVPGLAPNTGTSSNSGQMLRGRAPLIMIDGIPQSTPLRNGALDIRTLDASVIERIEVIKGATSVYGNGASGGIINYITKKAAAEKDFSGQAGLSTRFSAVKFEDSTGVRADAQVAGNIEKFSYLVSAAHDKSGLQYDPDGDIQGQVYGLSDTKTRNYFTKWGYQFTDSRQLQFSYNHFSGQQFSDLIDIPGSVNSGTKTYAVRNTNPDTPRGEPQGPRGNENFLLQYTDRDLLSNTAMNVDAYSQTIENVFFLSSALANPEQGYDAGQSIIKSDKTGLRVGFNSVFDWQDTEATLIYGLDLLRDISSQPLVDGRIWVPEMDMKSKAAYLQSKWIWRDDWILKAGVRQEEIKLSVDDYQTLRLCRDATTCSVPMQVTGGELDYEATTYNLALRYNAHPYFRPFISYSQGADISDLGLLLRAATVNDIDLIQTQASIIDSYEIGFNSDIDKLRLEFSAYRSTSELGTRTQLDPATGVYLPVRAPQKIWGYEVAAHYPLLDTLTASASYSYVEGKDTDADVYLDGSKISPPKLTAQLKWQPLNNADVVVNYMRIGNRQRFEPVDGQYGGTQGPVSSYDLVNVSATYRLDNWQLSAGIENLFNENYFPARSQAYTYSGYNSKGLGTMVNLGVRMFF